METISYSLLYYLFDACSCAKVEKAQHGQRVAGVSPVASQMDSGTMVKITPKIRETPRK